MGLFNRPARPAPTEKHSFTDVIQNEGGNTKDRQLIAWRDPRTDFNTHAKLIVRRGEEAIFENGAGEWAVFPEGTECELHTQNIAFIRSFREALSGGRSRFPCRVYFVSTEDFEIPWGTLSPISYTCPLIGPGALLTGNGIYVIRVVDSAMFAKSILRDSESYSVEDMRDKMFHRIYKNISAIIARELEARQIASTSFSDSAEEISQLCIPKVQKLLDDYGIQLRDFTISLWLDEEQRQMYEQNVRAQRMDAQGAAFARDITAESKKKELETMGSDYMTIKGMDLLNTIAENPAGGIAGAGAGLGMGMAAGAAFGNVAQSLFSNVPQPNAPNTPPTGQPDPMESLKTMKQMLDAGLISQEIYDKKVAEILNRL